MMKFEAILKLNSQVVRIVGDDAFDANGNIVNYDKNAIEEFIKSEEYKEKRALEYPPITDYLDGIVKGNSAQIQTYIDACKAVKNKYPKGEA